MTAFLYAVNAILPILLTCAVGYLLKRLKIIDSGFVSVTNKIIFKLLLPCLLFTNIYSIEDFSAIDWTLVLFCVIGVLVVFGLGILLSVIFVKEKNQKGVVALSSFRSNSVIIGLSLILILFGEAGGAKMSIVLAFVIPLYSLLGVTVLSAFPQDNQKPSFGKVLLNIVKNPITIGVVLGLIAIGIRSIFVSNQVEFRLTDISWLYSVIKSLGGVTTTLALIALGGEFEFSASKHLVKPIAVSVIMRLVVAPVLAFLVAFLFFKQFTGVEYAVLLCIFAAPTAVTCVAMSAEMGHDEELAGQIVVWTTILSFLTLFIYIFVLSQMGILV